MYYTKFDCKICQVTVIGDEAGITRIHLEAKGSNKELQVNEFIRNDDLFKEAKTQLVAYFKGTLKEFHLKLNPKGTDFQKKVWQALETIPYGETRSYKDIALMIGNDKASRAVGMANGKNPIPVVIPCHRVIGANGKLTGFAFGINLKQKMIELEADDGKS